MPTHRATDLVLLALLLLAPALTGCLDDTPGQEDPEGTTLEPRTHTPGGEGPGRSPGAPSPSAYEGNVVASLAADGVVVHQPGSGPLPASAYGGGLPRFEQRTLPGVAFEPTLGVTPDGTVAYAGLDAMARGPDTPAGQPEVGSLTHPLVLPAGETSWVQRPPETAGQRSHPIGFDPYLHVDPLTGRIFVVDLYVACTSVSYSDDAGESWRTNPVACGQPVNDHQTLFTGPAPAGVETKGYPNVVYLCTNDFAAGVWCTRSLDGAGTFEPARPVVIHEEGDNRLHLPARPCDEGMPTGHGRASPVDGTVLLPHGICGAARVYRSTDAGQTFQEIVIDEETGLSPDGVDREEVRVAFDRDGTAYAFWIAADQRPRLSVSVDGGESWSEPVDVAPPGIEAARFPAITAGTSGRVAVLYYGASQAPNAQTPWHGYVTMTLDAPSSTPTLATARVSPEGDPLALGPCEGRCRTDGWAEIGDFLDIAHDPSTGRVWAALADGCAPGACPPEHRDGIAAVGTQIGGALLVEGPPP